MILEHEHIFAVPFTTDYKEFTYDNSCNLKNNTLSETKSLDFKVGEMLSIKKKIKSDDKT